MIKLNFNSPLMGLDGKAIDADMTLGKRLGNLLSVSNKGDAVKYMDWAKKLYRGEVLELDRSDKRTLIDFIKGHDELINLMEDQLLSIIYEAEKTEKDVPEKKK